MAFFWEDWNINWEDNTTVVWELIGLPDEDANPHFIEFNCYADEVFEVNCYADEVFDVEVFG